MLACLKNIKINRKRKQEIVKNSRNKYIITAALLLLFFFIGQLATEQISADSLYLRSHDFDANKNTLDDLKAELISSFVKGKWLAKNDKNAETLGLTSYTLYSNIAKQNTVIIGVRVDANNDGDVRDADDYTIYNDFRIEAIGRDFAVITPALRIGDVMRNRGSVVRIAGKEYMIKDYIPDKNAVVLSPVTGGEITLINASDISSARESAIPVPGSSIAIGMFNYDFNAKTADFVIVKEGAISEITEIKKGVDLTQDELGLLTDYSSYAVELGDDYIILVFSKKADEFVIYDGDFNVFGYAKAVIESSPWSDNELRFEDSAIKLFKGELKELGSYTYAEIDENGYFDIVFLKDKKAPEIKIYSPENRSYSSRSIILSYEVSDPSGISEVYYSVDGAEKILLENATGELEICCLSEGMHYIEIFATDNFGNSAEKRVYFEIRIKKAEEEISVITVDRKFEKVLEDVALEIKTKENVEAKVNLTIYTDSPVEILSRETGLKVDEKPVKFVEIKPEEELKSFVDYALIKIHYSEDEIRGIDESTLSIYRYCDAEKRWQKIERKSSPFEITCGSERITVYSSGVNESGNYVYANLSSFSVYAISGVVFSTAEKPKAVIVANSIDRALAEDFFGFLSNEGIEISVVNAGEFESHKTAKFIIILGGPDAYEGVGDIVKQLISESEQQSIRAKGAKKMITITNKYASGQVIHILAGENRWLTKEAWQDNKQSIAAGIKG